MNKKFKEQIAIRIKMLIVLSAVLIIFVLTGFMPIPIFAMFGGWAIMLWVYLSYIIYKNKEELTDDEKQAVRQFRRSQA